MAAIERMLDDPAMAARWGESVGLDDPQAAHRALAGLSAMAENPTVALNEMLSTSKVLADLKASPDPGIPYFLVAGNTVAVGAGPDIMHFHAATDQSTAGGAGLDIMPFHADMRAAREATRESNL